MPSVRSCGVLKEADITYYKRPSGAVLSCPPNHPDHGVGYPDIFSTLHPSVVSGRICGLDSHRIGKLLRHVTALRGYRSVREVRNSSKERFKMRRLTYTIT
jgi:hypothetical protein